MEELHFLEFWNFLLKQTPLKHGVIVEASLVASLMRKKALNIM